MAIDWADKKHAVSLYDPATGEREQTIVKHTPQALQEWALSLRDRLPAPPIAVCLEQSRGPLMALRSTGIYERLRRLSFTRSNQGHRFCKRTLVQAK